jgi:hypothetical protein
MGGPLLAHCPRFRPFRAIATTNPPSKALYDGFTGQQIYSRDIDEIDTRARCSDSHAMDEMDGKNFPRTAAAPPPNLDSFLPSFLPSFHPLTASFSDEAPPFTKTRHPSSHAIITFILAALRFHSTHILTTRGPGTAFLPSPVAKLRSFLRALDRMAAPEPSYNAAAKHSLDISIF